MRPDSAGSARGRAGPGTSTARAVAHTATAGGTASHDAGVTAPPAAAAAAARRERRMSARRAVWAGGARRGGAAGRRG